MKMRLTRWVPWIFSLSLAAFSGVLDEASARSKQAGKPILIDFYAVWCGPCKAFDRDSQTDEQIKEALADVVIQKIDAEKGEGIKIARDYEVKGFPTYVLLNKDLQVIYRWVGYERNYFLENFRLGMKNPIPLADKLAQFKQKPTEENAVFLARYHESLSDYDSAIEAYETAERVKEDPHTSYRFNIFEIKFSRYYSEPDKIAYESIRAEANALLEGDDLEDGPRLAVAEMGMSMAKNERRGEDVAHFVKRALPLAKALPEADGRQERLERLSINYALHVEQSPKKAFEMYRDLLPEDWESDAQSLNRLSWWCFENGVLLEEARLLAIKGISLSEPGQDRAMILDTQAEIENALGNPAEAVRLMELAVEDHPERKAYRRQLERFQALVEEAVKKGS